MYNSSNHYLYYKSSLFGFLKVRPELDLLTTKLFGLLDDLCIDRTSTFLPVSTVGATAPSPTSLPVTGLQATWAILHHYPTPLAH